jgi:DNA-directed RNA polymerase specialized sigma24 family protein
MKGYDYYSVDEFRQALESNEDNLLLRCTVLAKSLVNKYELRMEAYDLFQEAICRVLADSRHIPKGVPLFVSVGKIMKGIAYDTFERKDEEILRHYEPIDMHEDSVTTAQTLYNGKLDNAWEDLLSLFSEDEDVLSFLKATSDGLKKSEIVEQVFSGDVNRYDTTRRRIVRCNIGKLQEEA